MQKKPKTYKTPTRKNGLVRTSIHKSKTRKICSCCKEPIITGILYVKKVGVHQKRFYSSHFHYSCFHFYSNSILGLINPYHAILRVK